jgi:ParB-like chromosome segregation protein Spo0J
MPKLKPSQAPPPKWQSRITGEGEEAPDQLLANPSNWRVHTHEQERALATVLDEVGWVQRVIVNRTTGHVVDGHLRVAMAISRGAPSVPPAYCAVILQRMKDTFPEIVAERI